MLQLTRIEDPRDPLEKRRRIELVEYARRHKIDEINENMPAILMRRILRKRGIYDLDRPHIEPVLGKSRGAHPVIEQQESMPVIDAEEALIAQYTDKKKPVETIEPNMQVSVDKPLKSMTVFQLRSVCKQRGMKVKRTSTKQQLLAMLHEQDITPIGE